MRFQGQKEHHTPMWLEDTCSESRRELEIGFRHMVVEMQWLREIVIPSHRVS